MRVEMLTFLLSALICLGGALGVVLLRNTVHSALSLIATLFGIAILFMNLGAYFLAAVQVIVYAGAVVVLFLFVIMLLGVDKIDHLERELYKGERFSAVAVGAAILGLSVTALLSVGASSTGRAEYTRALDASAPDINGLARALFTDYVFAFEITSVLLTIAVVGAVVLARRGGPAIDLAEFPDGPAVSDEPEPEPEPELESEAAEDASDESAAPEGEAAEAEVAG